MNISRRAMLASGAGLAAFGDLLSNLGYAEETGVKENAWKFTPVDPDKVADYAYAQYASGGCLYGAFKGAVLAYADAVESTDADAAKIARSCPFVAFRCARGGFGRLRELCGAVAGSVMFFSCFCENASDVNAMAAELGEWAKTTALPTYVPEKNEHPNLFQFVANGLTCREMGAGWVGAAPEEQKKLTGERCARHTASIVKKAAEILNAFFAEKAKANA